MDIITGSRPLMGLGAVAQEVYPYEVWWAFEEANEMKNGVLAKISASGLDQTSIDTFLAALKVIRDKYFDAERRSVEDYESSVACKGVNSCNEMLARANNYKQRFASLNANIDQSIIDAQRAKAGGSAPPPPRIDPIAVTEQPPSPEVAELIKKAKAGNTLLVVGGVALLAYAAYLYTKE